MSLKQKRKEPPNFPHDELQEKYKRTRNKETEQKQQSERDMVALFNGS